MGKKEKRRALFSLQRRQKQLLEVPPLDADRFVAAARVAARELASTDPQREPVLRLHEESGGVEEITIKDTPFARLMRVAIAHFGEEKEETLSAFTRLDLFRRLPPISNDEQFEAAARILAVVRITTGVGEEDTPPDVDVDHLAQLWCEAALEWNWSSA